MLVVLNCVISLPVSFSKDWKMATSDQKNICDALIEKLLSSGRSPLVTVDKYDKIVRYLINPNEFVNAHFKFWIKLMEFQMMDLPALGVTYASVVPARNGSGEKKSLQIVPATIFPGHCLLRFKLRR